MFINGEPNWLNPQSWDAYDIYMTTPELYAVIQRRGYLLASGVWRHYDRNGEEIDNSEVVKVLNNPNPLMNGRDFLRQYNENKCLFGNNYEYLLKPYSSSQPVGLTNLNPATIQIQTTGKFYKQSTMEDIVKAYKLMYGTDVSDVFEPSEINHTRLVNSQNPIVGESPLRALYMPITNIRSAYGFRNIIMNKKGALGILSNASKDSSGAIPLNEIERQRLEKEYQKNYGIDDNQMQVIMTNSSLNWQPMSYPTKDLMLFEEVDADFRKLIDAYGLNDNIFSREKGTTFTNMAEGLKQAYETTIIPEAEEISMNRTRVFGLDQRGEFLKLCYDHIPVLQEDKSKEAERVERIANAVQTLVNAGFPNEARDLLG
jgi:HK97 family phage portal protein